MMKPERIFSDELMDIEGAGQVLNTRDFILSDEKMLHSVFATQI